MSRRAKFGGRETAVERGMQCPIGRCVFDHYPCTRGVRYPTEVRGVLSTAPVREGVSYHQNLRGAFATW